VTGRSRGRRSLPSGPRWEREILPDPKSGTISPPPTPASARHTIFRVPSRRLHGEARVSPPVYPVTHAQKTGSASARSHTPPTPKGGASGGAQVSL
jgi:hypothetical protein